MGDYHGNRIDNSGHFYSDLSNVEQESGDLNKSL